MTGRGPTGGETRPTATHQAAAGVPYEVRRSPRAQRARLMVEEGGAVVVVIPARAPLEAADRMVADHRAWIERHRARVLTREADLATRPPLGEGRILAVDGSPRRVQVVDAVAARPRRGHVEEADGSLLVRLGRDAVSAERLLEGWLRERALRTVILRVAERAREMGVSPGRVAVRDQRTRWGSASPSGDLSFSWRLVLAPAGVLDAVVVHELAHLRYRSHGPRFWALVNRHAPTTDEHRRWLREHGHELRAALL